MKRTDEDIRFSQLLKQHTPEQHENPWLSRKVLNRLPQKSNSIPVAVYAIFICIIAATIIFGWIYYLKGLNLNVVTVRDVFSLALMLATSIIILASSIFGLFKNEF